MERQVYKYLVRDSGMSQSSLQRLFKKMLKSPPKNVIRSKGKVHLLIDGTYFENGLCLILYYDFDIQYVQLFRETDQEKLKEIREDLQNLKKLGVDVYSVTCDGHKSIMRALKQVYPSIVIQRCIIHVKRQVKSYLGANPILDQGKELLRFSNKITNIKNIDAAYQWLVEFQRWYDKNEQFINEKSLNPDTGKWWYTHKNLQRASTHLINAVPNLFAFLNDPEIPYSTNQLEGYFSHLKEKLTLHRGLRFDTKKNFIKWYLHFKNEEKTSRFF